MKTIRHQLHDAFLDAKQKQFDHIVIAIDLHNTIIDSNTYNDTLNVGKTIEEAVCASIYEGVIKPLQLLSLRKDIQLMLFSGTKMGTLQIIAKVLFDHYGIEFEHINEYVADDPTPRITNQSFRNKPYYSILWDDKAGFAPHEDWPMIEEVIGNFSTRF